MIVSGWWLNTNWAALVLYDTLEYLWRISWYMRTLNLTSIVVGRAMFTTTNWEQLWRLTSCNHTEVAVLLSYDHAVLPQLLIGIGKVAKRTNDCLQAEWRPKWFSLNRFLFFHGNKNESLSVGLLSAMEIGSYDSLRRTVQKRKQ